MRHRVWPFSASPLACLVLVLCSVPVRAEASALQSAAAMVDAGPDPFAKGSRYWSVAGGSSRKPSLVWFGLTQIMVRHYLVDDLALEYGGQVGYMDADRTSTGAFGGPEVGMRWHVAKRKRWTIFVEALAGAVYQAHPLAPAGLRFNFDLQGGGGATYRLTDDALLGGGVRAHHLSNARIRGPNHNPGYDGTMLYLELMRSF